MKERPPRRRVVKRGRIAFQNLGATIDCKVHDLSADGACLIVQSQVGIPDLFSLIIDSDQISRRCRVAWRSANRIGVAFL